MKTHEDIDMKQLTGHFKKHFDYRFLASDELTQDVVVKIKSITKDQAFNGREKEDVVVIHFEGKKKGIIINKTNAKRITKIAGSPNMEDWIGVEITLTNERVSAYGATMDAIRVKVEPNPIFKA